MPTDTLSDARCRGAKPQAKPYKLFDGGGLHLFVSPTGAKVWRLAYRRRVGGALKPATMSFGPYPEVGLAEARRRRDEARQTLRDGGDPMAPRRATRSITLREACDAYWAGRRDITDAYKTNALRCMDMHIHPELGDKPLAGISRADLLGPLNKMDAAGLHDYVRKARLWLAAVLAWGIEQQHCEHNPAKDIDPEKAFGKVRSEHFAALQPHEMRELLGRLSLENQHLQSLLAFRCLAYTWLRTVELRTLLKTDRIAPDTLLIPAGRMKRPHDHQVPLPTQAQAILDHMAERYPKSPYFWPGDRTPDKPMSENAVLYLLHRVGFKGRMTGHGLRSVGSTWANEAGWNPDAVERQLAHVPKNETRSAYNRAKYITERRTMLQAWADWFDEQGESK